MKRVTDKYQKPDQIFTPKPKSKTVSSDGSDSKLIKELVEALKASSGGNGGSELAPINIIQVPEIEIPAPTVTVEMPPQESVAGWKTIDVTITSRDNGAIKTVRLTKVE